jgi:hypothetical protein
LQGPGVIIDGGCQNDKADAKAEACRIADQYISKQGRDAAMPPFPLVEWTPLESHAFLVWQAQGQRCGSSREVAKLAAQKESDAPMRRRFGAGPSQVSSAIARST